MKVIVNIVNSRHIAQKRTLFKDRFFKATDDQDIQKTNKKYSSRTKQLLINPLDYILFSLNAKEFMYF